MHRGDRSRTINNNTASGNLDAYQSHAALTNLAALAARPPRPTSPRATTPRLFPPRSTLFTILLFSLLLSPLFPARQTSAQVSLPAQPELPRLLDLCAQRLNLRISYDEQSLKGRITLRAEQPLSDADLWSLTNRLLIEQGSTTIRAGDDDTIAVVKLSSAAAMARLERIDLASLPPSPAPSGEVASAAKAEGVRTPAASKSPSTFSPQPAFRRLLIPLQRCSTKDALAAVQLLLSKGSGPAGSSAGVAAESEQSGLIILADLTSYLDGALKLLAQLDGPDGGATVREVPARNVDPTRLAALAKQLADKRKLVGGRDLRGELLAAPSGTGVLIIAPATAIEQWLALLAAADQREPVERRTYTPGSFPARDVANLIEQTVRTTSPNSAAGAAGTTSTGSTADDRWRIVFDDLTGSLIITATTVQHDQITELLTRLASVPVEARRPVRSFKIRNRPVKEVQQLVEDLLRAGVLQAQQGTTPPSAPGPASATNASPQTSPRPFSPGGTSPLAAESGTSSTYAPASARSSTLSSSLTLTSDESTNTLIAVGGGDGSGAHLLAQLEQLLPPLDVRQPQVMLEALLISLSDSDSLTLGVELEKLRFSGDTLIRLSSLFGLSSASGSGSTASRSVGDGSGFTGVVLDPGDFSIVFRALQTINKGRSLSQPRLLVNNNQQATFNSVLQQPFASTNASSTVSTTSFGGTQDAGTTISVKPQIAEGDHLVLNYSVSLSSFVGAAANANLPPPRQQNAVQSTATIPDGYTVVVGGLELTTSGEGISQVPILGSIPLIGEAFKNRSNSSGRQRFYVFLRATVLRQSNLEDLKYLSDIDASAAGIPSDWPTVEPLIIGAERPLWTQER